MKKIVPISIILIFVLVLLSASLYVVGESQQVIITQFGKPVGEPVLTPGLKFKTPFIQTANFFDKRFLEWDGDPDQVTTKDKKYVFVDTYARWQIIDPLQFFKRFKDERSAQSRLDDILDGETRDYIANNNIEEAVRNSNRKPVPSGIIGELVGDTLFDIEVGRSKIEKMILEDANKLAMEQGIAILDFRFKRMNYNEEVRTQVYERMKSERYRIADKFRSEGQGEASRINGEKERELQTIQSEAFKTAEEIKGRADAKAAAIYSDAYNKNSTSRNLYSFLKAMETFEKTLDSETSVILSTESDLFRYLKSMD